MNRQLHIVHIHTVPVISGSGINTLLTMRASIERGHRVTLICSTEGPLVDQSRRAGVVAEFVPDMVREVSPIRDLRALLDLRRRLVRLRPDIVHTHNSKAGFLGRRAARGARVPLVVHTVHGFAFHDAEPSYRRWLFRRLERTAGRWADGIIFISKPLEDWAAREGIGRTVPTRVIPSGIDADAFRTADGAAFRLAHGIPADAFVAGIVSKLWEGKGHAHLLNAWRIVRDRLPRSQTAVLAIIGQGPLEADLRRQAERLGLAGAVKFTGFTEDVPGATAALDISVLPSLFEGMGRVVLEAMAAGKAVVASSVGGIPDLVEDGVSGILVPPGSVDRLADAIHGLATDAGRRRKLGQHGQAAFRPEFTAPHMVDRIHDFYTYLHERKG